VQATNNLFLVSFISSTHTSLFCLSNLLLVIIGMCEFIWEISLKSPKLFICFICNPVLSTLLCFICEAYLVHLLNLGWIRTLPYSFHPYNSTLFFHFSTTIFHHMTIYEPQATYHPILCFTKNLHLV